jgi:hypothetical protein
MRTTEYSSILCYLSYLLRYTPTHLPIYCSFSHPPTYALICQFICTSTSYFYPSTCIYMVVVVFHHEIRPMWPVSVSIWTPSNRRLRGLPGHLLPRGWYSISAFGNLELFMRWTCFTQLCLYFVIFSRTDVVLSSCKMSSYNPREYITLFFRT